MSLFLLLVIVAIVLGLIGAVAELGWLLAIGVIFIGTRGEIYCYVTPGGA